jgi:hypothetical protein
MWQPERFWNADHGFGNGGSGNPAGKAATTGEATITTAAMAAATNKTREGEACEAIADETRRGEARKPSCCHVSFKAPA